VAILSEFKNYRFKLKFSPLSGLSNPLAQTLAAVINLSRNLMILYFAKYHENSRLPHCPALLKLHYTMT